jgi:hypothetical protein
MVVEGKVFWGLSEILPSRRASRIKVYGPKNGDKFERYLTERIKSYFPQSGKVFAPLPIDSFCTFQVEANNSKKENGDDYLAIPASLKPLKPYMLILRKNLLNVWLSLEELQNIGSYRQHFEDGIYYIKITDTNELIGPFIKDQRGLLPKIGKEASAFDLSSGSDDLLMENYNDNAVFFNSPDICLNKKIKMVDCMSGEQLQEWFRNKLNAVHGLSSEKENAINIIMEMLKKKSLASANDLDTHRFNRIFENLDQFKFSYAELRDHLVDDDGFEKIVRKIEEMRQEIKSEYESEFQKDLESLKIEKQNIENEKNGVIADIEKLNTEKNSIATEIADAGKLLESLHANYDSILVQLKVASQIGGYSTINNSRPFVKPLCYKIPRSGRSFTELKTDGDSYQGLELYFRIMEKNLTRAGYDEKIFNLFKDNENSLLKSQAVFIPCVSWAYIFAQSVGNAKLYVIHIEHDWLHYKNFCDNGIISIWNEAADEQDTNFILAFEDLNITQPECGFTPLLDVINGYRPLLEGTESGLLTNLKIFAALIPPGEENIGLKLPERLFRKWGRFGDFIDINFMYPVKNRDFIPFGYFAPEDLATLYDNAYHAGGPYFE